MEKFSREVFLELPSPEEQELYLRSVDLRNADLSGLSLRNFDLHDLDFSEADFRGADLFGADCRDVTFRGADLFGADMRGVDICDACFRGADIELSSWTFGGGSLGAVIDARIAYRLAFHFCSMDCDDNEFIEVRNAMLEFANKFHRSDIYGKLLVKGGTKC